MQRRGSFVVNRVDYETLANEVANGLDTVAVGGVVERLASRMVSAVAISPALEQQLGYLGVVVLTGEMQGCSSIHVTLYRALHSFDLVVSLRHFDFLQYKRNSSMPTNLFKVNTLVQQDG
jgi:hypothetical protein